MENRKPVNFSIRPSIQCVENTSKFSFPCNIFDRHFLSKATDAELRSREE